MRILSRGTLVQFWDRHPKARPSLEHWCQIAGAANWSRMDDVMTSFPKAKALNAERARFEVAGGNFRMIVAINFKAKMAYIKFLGSHAEYDRIDALTVSDF